MFVLCAIRQVSFAGSARISAALAEFPWTVMDVQGRRPGGLWGSVQSEGAARFLSAAVCTTQSVGRMQPLPATRASRKALLPGGEGAEFLWVVRRKQDGGTEWYLMGCPFVAPSLIPALLSEVFPCFLVLLWQCYQCLVHWYHCLAMLSMLDSISASG